MQCLIEDPTSKVRIHLSVVYAQDNVNQRHQLWTDLRNIPIPSQDPWLLSGDFNNVLSSEDRIGSPVTEAEIKEFKDVINDLQLTPLRSKGWHYTWTISKVQLEEFIVRLIGPWATTSGYRIMVT